MGILIRWNNISKWIWVNEEQKNDTYGEFYSEFEYSGDEINIRISADSNYALYLNGEYVYSGQYSDFPSYKVYDEIPLTSYAKKGINKLSIVVWYYGKSNLSYYPGKAAVKYEVYQGERIVDFSSEKTLSRLSKAFKNGYEKEITMQLGYSFLYDITLEDQWKTGVLVDFNESRIVKQDLPLFVRPVERNVVDKVRESKLIKKEKNYYLYDLLCEEVGFLNLKVKSDTKQKLIICYGEHIADGCVRYKIDARDFSVEVVVGEGVNEYTNYFRRLGLRYLEIHSENDIEIEYINVIKCEYPVTERKCELDNPLHKKIYDTAVRTLKLCMHEHYEDCPWREQGLYAADSRNQMLCGYYAFEETIMQRASLLLLAKSQLDCGLLELTSPAVFDITIPAFSLVWIKAVREYAEHTDDVQFVKEMLPVAKRILDFFAQRCKNGLVVTPTEKRFWNFYEWTYRMDNGKLSEGLKYDLPINAFVAIALMDYIKLCEYAEDKKYVSWAEEIYINIKSEFHKTFYCENRKAYKTYVDEKEEHFSQLCQALALLSGCVEKKYEDDIRKNATNDDFVKTSLSFKIFQYDALLQDEEKYKKYVLEDIDSMWGYMLENGATSFWETILGDSDFSNAGSLCHGWSAIPIYYYHKLKLIK